MFSFENLLGPYIREKHVILRRLIESCSLLYLRILIALPFSTMLVRPGVGNQGRLQATRDFLGMFLVWGFGVWGRIA